MICASLGVAPLERDLLRVDDMKFSTHTHGTLKALKGNKALSTFEHERRGNETVRKHMC